MKHSPSLLIAEYLAACLIGIILLPCLVFIALLCAKTNGEIKWMLPIATGAAVPLLGLVLLKGCSIKVKWLALGLFILAMTNALWVASWFYDPTWDSRAYHADGILLLLAGNNPFYDKMQWFDDLWTNHYPKITWYYAALLTHLTDNYNLGKSLSLIHI